MSKEMTAKEIYKGMTHNKEGWDNSLLVYNQFDNAAILSSVKNTWLKNLDPAKMDDLHTALWNVRAWILRNKLEFDFDSDSPETKFKDIENILVSACVK